VRLNRAGRGEYSLSIDLNPPIAGTWQASFDGGVTWIDGVPSSGVWSWLVAGPDFDAEDVGMDPAATKAVISSSVIPLLRIANNPILDVEYGYLINLVD